MKINRFTIIAAIAALSIAGSLWCGNTFPVSPLRICHWHPPISGHVLPWLWPLPSPVVHLGVWCGKVLLAVAVQALSHLASVALFAILFAGLSK